MPDPLKTAILGLGAIGRTLVAPLERIAGVKLVGALVRAGHAPEREAFPDLPLFTALEALLDARPGLVIECAGHAALAQYGPRILSAGVDLMVVSVGALSDPGLEAQLMAAQRTGGRLHILAGAIGGLDALGAAREAGLESVEYTGRKAPAAWRGTPAESRIDLDALSEATVFFEGTARQAAGKFPQNANVVAAIALAGLGFDRTKARLVADPAVSMNHHNVTARGAFGTLSVDIGARTLAENPRTSMLAPASIIGAVRSLARQGSA